MRATPATRYYHSDSSKNDMIMNSFIDVEVIKSVSDIKSDIFRIILTDNISKPEKSKIRSLVSDLESFGQNKSPLSFPSLWNDLSGDWELLYSNVLSQSKPQSSLLGIERVIQRINVSKPKPSIDHILQFKITNSQVNLIQKNLLNNIVLKEVKLIHDVEVSSERQPAQIRLILDHIDTVLETSRGDKTVSVNPLVPWNIFPLGLVPLRSGVYDVSQWISYRYTFNIVHSILMILLIFLDHLH